MEFDFDKEIDAILRKARGSESVFANTLSEPHLDADTLSAFAENALPEGTKKLCTAHLADCDRCRRILSNLISLNAETETVPFAATVSAPIAEPVIPWYRKLFFGVNPVYAMGALVVVFSAFTAYIVFQSSSGGLNSEISKTNEKPANARGPSAVEENPYSANSTSNTAMSNAASVASNTSSTMLPPSTNTSASNTASIAANTTAGYPSKSDSGTVGTAKEQNVAGGERFSDEEAKSKQPTTEIVTGNKKEADKDVVTLAQPEPEDRAVQKSVPAPAPKPSGDVKRDDSTLKAKRSMPEPSPATKGAAPNEEEKKAERKRAGGKNFRREGNVWIDGEYRQGAPLTNVSRGSNEYRKLDRGLRNIAEQFNETVIVVWKSKNYRIQ